MASSVLCAKLIQSYEQLLLLSALGGVVMSNIPMLMDTGGNAGSQSSTLKLCIRDRWRSTRPTMWSGGSDV